MANNLKIVAIANPISGLHQSPRKWPLLLKTIGKKAEDVITWWTESPGHAEILAARARREGYERVVIVGGDGTLFEVVNGLWWEQKGKLPSIGAVPFGTGCDYVRNFNIGHNLFENTITALGESVVPIDAGICHLHSLDGKPRKRIFVNVLGFGFDGNVIERFKRRKIKIKGKIPYLFSILKEIGNAKYYKLKGIINESYIKTDILFLVIGLGRYFGAGMMITPNASPHANRFQVVWSQEVKRMEVLALLSLVYFGKHIRFPKIHTRFAKEVQVITDPSAYIEAEGELIGRTPIAVEIFPSAFNFAAIKTS